MDKHTFFCAFFSNVMWRYITELGFFLLLKLNVPTAGFEPVIICSVANLDSVANHYTTVP